MKFNPTPLEGAFTIDLEKREDDRGFFARLFCENEFDNVGLDRNIVQINNSLSKDKGTLRGIHYQLSPKAETKIVRCIKGSLFDVIVDLRPGSKTFLKWFGATLSAENRTMMFVPKGFGHAFLTLEENTEAFYMVTEFYSPENERGMRWNDPKIGIEWPITPIIISEKDMNHRDFDINYHCNI
jgi:dTDP-4-dehydrorhamnose 3,5-epimerase